MFIDQTRQNFLTLPKKDFSSGQVVSFPLPAVGLLSRLFLYINGSMNVTLNSGTAVLSENGPWNLIRRITLKANSGTAIYDVSGWGTYIINSIKRVGHMPDKTIYNQNVGTEMFNAGVSAGANPWAMTLEIPIAVNERDPVGLLLMQNKTTEMTLDITFNTEYALTDIGAPVKVTGAAVAALTAKVGLAMEFFNVPKDPKDYPALNIIHQWLEQRDNFSSTGAFQKQLAKGDTYMRLIHSLTCAGTRNTTCVDFLRILYNQNQVPYQIDKQPMLSLMRDRYGMDLPTGIYVHDFYYSGGIPGLGTSRDLINSAGVTDFISELNINSATTVTAGSTFLDTISEKLITIA